MYSLNTGTVVVLGTHHCMARVNELVDVFITYRTVVVLGTHHCMARVNELVDVFIKYRDRRGARNTSLYG